MKNIIAIILVLFSCANLFAQTKNNPRYDIIKKVHFGFLIGTNISDVDYRFSDDFYKNDSAYRIDIGVIPGITLGAIVNFHIKERLDLRLIPGLILAQRNVTFQFNDNYGTINKTVESVYADIPVLFKYKSTRHNNWRFYLIGGGQYSYDIAAKEGREKDFINPNIAYKRHNYYYSYGCGFDLYFPYFKLSPEIKVSNGLNNVLDPHKTVYSSSFDKLLNRMIFISFQFE